MYNIAIIIVGKLQYNMQLHNNYGHQSYFRCKDVLILMQFNISIYVFFN